MTHTLKEILQKSKNIVFLGGAGVSTESGIPDFRSQDGALKALSQYGHSSETLLSYSFFKREPEIFYAFLRTIIHSDAQPNAAHKALARLEAEGKLRAVITQNIDGLHQQAGSKTVHELHGSIFRHYCIGCGRTYSLESVLTQMDNREHEEDNVIVPRCLTCENIVRPDVVLYEEALDAVVLEKSIAAIEQADTLIVGGTSLVVYPAAGLLRYFKGTELVLINKSETPHDHLATLIINDSIGKVLGQWDRKDC